MNRAALDPIYDDIDNWVRCVRFGYVRGHCASIEGRYRAERGEGLESRRQPRIEVIESRGWLVETAWRTLPDVERWMLKLHFIRNQEDHMVMRGIVHHTGQAVKRWHFVARLNYAVMLLKRAVDKLDGARVLSEAQFETAEVKRDRAPSGALARPAKTEPAVA